MNGGINKLPLWENKYVTFSIKQSIVIFCEILRSLRYIHCKKESLEDTLSLFDLAKDAFISVYLWISTWPCVNWTKYGKCSHARHTQSPVNGILFLKSHIADFSSSQNLEF